jgi:hypothetical protein
MATLPNKNALADLSGGYYAYWTDGTTEGRATLSVILGSTDAQAAAASFSSLALATPLANEYVAGINQNLLTTSSPTFAALTVGQQIFDTAAGIESNAAGEMSWDADAETVMLALDDQIHMHIGQDSFYHVINQTGSDIPKGTGVYATGTVGNSGKITIAPFTADGTVSSKYFMGVTAEAIANGATGFVVHFGKLRKIDTTDFEEGDILFADPSVAGGLTATKPDAPNNIITVAIVVTKSDTVGELFVRPTFIDGFADNEDVTVTSATTGDLLRYNGTVWVNYPDSNFASATGLSTHIADTTNPHSVTKTQVGLGNVENTALSTWAGSSNITTLGTIGTGVWQGTAIDSAYIDPTLSVTSVAAGTLSLASGSITDSSGAISFGNENLSTTGTLASGNLTVTSTGTSLVSSTSVDTFRVERTVSGGGVRLYLKNGNGNEYRFQNAAGPDNLSIAYNGATRYEIDVSGNHNFQAGNLTTTGTLASGNHTISNNDQTNGSSISIRNTFSGGSWVASDIIGEIGFYSSDGSGPGAGNKGLIQVTSGVSGNTPYGSMKFYVANTSNEVEALELRYDATGHFASDLTIGGTLASGNATVTGSGVFNYSASSDWTTLLSSVSNYTALFKTRSDSSASLRIGSYGSGAQAIQVSNSGGTTAYDLYLNPFGGAVQLPNTTVTGTLGVTNGSSGATADGAADDFVLQGNGDAGLSILTPDGSASRILFGSASDATGAQLFWEHNLDLFQVGTRKSGASFILKTGENATALTLDSSQNATFAGNVYAKSSTVNTSWVFDGSTDGGIAVGSGYADGRLYAEGSQSASVVLHDSGGVANQKTVALQTNGGTIALNLYNDSGTLNSGLLSFNTSTSAATFAGDVTVQDLILAGSDIRRADTSRAITVGTNIEIRDSLAATFVTFNGTDQSSTFAGDLTLSANNSTLTFATNTVAAGDRLGAIVFHDTDGATGANSGELHITGERGSDKDAPDYVLKIANASGVLTERDRIDGTTGARTLTGNLTLSAGNLTVNGNTTTLGSTSNTTSIVKMVQDAQEWDLVVTSAEEFRIRDVTGGNDDPFIIEVGAPEGLMQLGSNGQVMLQSSNDAPLRLYSTDGTTGIRFDDPDGNANLFYRGNTNTLYSSNIANFVLGATSTANNAQIYALKTHNSASGTDIGIYLDQNQSTATTGEMRALYSRAQATHTSGTVDLMMGVFGEARVSGAGGTTTDAAALWARVRNLDATATITNAYGLYIDSFTQTGTITNNWSIYSANGGASYLAGDLRIGTTSAGPNSENLVVDSGASGIAGYFDSGVTQRTLVLHTDDTTNGKQLVLHDAGSSGYATSMIGSKSDALLFYTGSGGAEAMRVDTSGRLLVGTTSATSGGSETLRVSGGFQSVNVHGSSGSNIQVTDNTTGTSTSDGLLVGYNASQVAQIYNYESTPIRFATNATERFRVASDAYALGIGTTDVESWDVFAAIEFAESSIAGHMSNDALYLSSNAYYSGGWKRKVADESVQFLLNADGNGFQWNSAASGAADSEISWNTKMVLSPEGMLLVGDTANTGMTVGLTINQGGNDDEILAFKSSDVAHGMTSISETDTYGSIRKASGSSGGLLLDTFGESSLAMVVRGNVVSNVTTKTTSSRGGIDLRTYKKSGTSIGANDANANLISIGDAANVRFIVDAEGDWHYDGADGGAFDAYQDAHLVRAFANATSKETVRTAHDDWVQYNEQTLVDIGVLGAPVSEGGLINGAQLQRVHTGAIWQNYMAISDTKDEVETLRARLDIAETKLAIAESKLKQLPAA